MKEPAIDVPSPIDLRREDHASEWAATAMLKRPYRAVFFDKIAESLAGANARRVLELGSGPGFLALHLGERLASTELTLLDFSPAMHALARMRLGALSRSVTFVERSFGALDWTDGLGTFDAVVTMQAVHELRHKRHASTLHAAVRRLLVSGGQYLVCDHYVGTDGMRNEDLYMTPSEQRLALQSVGFHDVTLLLQDRGLVLHAAR